MKKSRLLILLFFCLMLTACGFKPHSANDIPPPLRILYLDTPNPDSPLSVQLQRLLRSVNVRFVNDPALARLTLHISDSHWTYNIPTILYSGSATTYTYTLTIDYALQTPRGRAIIGPTTLSLTRSLIQNANQLYTPNATELMKREITRSMANLIYDNLTSIGTRQALQHANTR